MKKLFIFSVLVLSNLFGQKIDYINQLNNKPFIDVREFAGWYRTNGSGVSADLSSTGVKILTFTSCPKAITGASTTTRVRIYDGTGTAETPLVLGGTCAGIGTAGTLIVTTTQTHTGAWKVGTATAGIQEALNSQAKPQLAMSCAEHIVYATVTFPSGTTIRGCGTAQSTNVNPSTTILYYGGSTDLFYVNTDNITITNMRLSQVSLRGSWLIPSGGGATLEISTAVAGAGIHAVNPTTGLRIEDVEADFFYRGFYFDGTNPGIANVTVEDIIGSSSVLNGIEFSWTGGHATKILGQFSQQHGIALTGGISPVITSALSFNNKGRGLHTDGTTIQLQGGTFQADLLGAIYINSNYNAGCSLTNINIQSAGITNTWGTDNNSPGLEIASTSGNCDIANFQIQGTNGNGILLSGQHTRISSGMVYQAGLGLQAGHKYCINIAGNLNIVTNLDCLLDSPAYISGAATIFTSNNINYDSATVPAIEFAASAIETTFANNFIFQSNAAPAVTVNAGATAVNGTNNIFGTVSGSFGYTTRSIPTVEVHQMRIPTALVVTANTIAPTLSVHHVGAGLIKTITPPANFAGCMKFIADAAFTTDTTGNIASSALTAVVNQVYDVCYDASVAKWFFSN
jgi:hypothetical protein